MLSSHSPLVLGHEEQTAGGGQKKERKKTLCNASFLYNALFFSFKLG